MGTDIHMFVERRRVDGTWELIKKIPPRPCSRCRYDDYAHCDQVVAEGKSALCVMRKGHDPGYHMACYRCGGSGEDVTAYSGRNYDLFAILANVRNGSGFAGCDTGDGFVSMVDLGAGAGDLGDDGRHQRGVPDDMSAELRRIYDGVTANETDPDVDDDYDDWLGDHSFSWVTMREAIDYDYSRSTKHRGVVDANEYRQWVAAGRIGPPSDYSGGVSGPGVRHVTNEEMDTILASGVELPIGVFDRTSIYTSVEWSETYRESVGDDWFRFLDALTPLGRPDDLRLVFGFDS
jgi:hypothetical protein